MASFHLVLYGQLVGLSLICHFFFTDFAFWQCSKFLPILPEIMPVFTYFARNYASTCLPILLVKEKLYLMSTKTGLTIIVLQRKRCFYNSLSKRSVNRSLLFSEYYKPTSHAPIACLDCSEKHNKLSSHSSAGRALSFWSFCHYATNYYLFCYLFCRHNACCQQVPIMPVIMPAD